MCFGRNDEEAGPSLFGGRGDGFARRVGVELAGPVCCLIPAGGMQMGVPESELALPLSSWLGILVGATGVWDAA